ncbi:MAG TPA: hypothetical protein ENK02_05155 [Planctomycetes bacterium]|nr:hypothetical protein [Planctomycetota bacterium]
MAIAFSLLLSASLFLPQGGTLPTGFQRVRTPDGSRFLLHKTEGRPVAVWIYVHRMGMAHDPYQLEGLSAACLKASLSAQPLREKLASLGATGLRLETRARTSSLQAVLPSDRILAFAALMRERRTRPQLQGLDQAFLNAHRERVRTFQNRRDLRPIREMALATILRDPVRAVLFPPSSKAGSISPPAALLFFQRHNLPDQGLTLIEGNFDPALVARGLSHIFNTPSRLQPPLVPPEEPLPSASRILRSHRPGYALAALAWRIPPGWSQDELGVLAHALQGAEVPGGEGLSFRAFPSFPSMGRPSLFALEARALGPGMSSEELLRHLRKRVDALLEGKTGRQLLTRANKLQRARARGDFDPPETRLSRLGRSILLGTYGGGSPDPTSLLAKARKLLQGRGECANLVDPIPSGAKEEKK